MLLLMIMITQSAICEWVCVCVMAVVAVIEIVASNRRSKKDGWMWEGRQTIEQERERERASCFYIFSSICTRCWRVRCTLVYMCMCTNKADKSTSKQYIIVYMYVSRLLAHFSFLSFFSFFFRHIHTLIEVHVVCWILIECSIKLLILLPLLILNTWQSVN